MREWDEGITERGRTIEKLHKIQRKLGILCKARGRDGLCSGTVELMVDRSQPSRLVRTREGYDWIYPTYRHPSGLCYYHRMRKEGKMVIPIGDLS